MQGGNGSSGAYFSSYKRGRIGSSNLSYTMSSSSSGSGTIVSRLSTTYPSSSSLLSSSVSMDMEATTMLHLDLESDEVAVEKKDTEEFILVRPLNKLLASANCSISSGGVMAVLERWFTELGIAWVLHISDDDASAGKLQHASDDYDAGPRWIRALNEIVSSTTALFPVHGRLRLGTASISEEEENPVKVVDVLREKKASVWDQLHCARFIHEAMLRMLIFIDVIVAPDPNTTRRDELVINSTGYRRHIYQKISFFLGVRSALSSASFEIQVPFLLTPSAQVKRIRDEMVNVLHAKAAKVDDAIWTAMEEIRAHILESSMEEEDSSGTPQRSLDIHNIARSAVHHITFMLDNYSRVAPVVSEAARLGKFVLPHIGNLPHLDNIFFVASHDKDRLHLPSPLDSMIMEMTSCLEGKLVKMSESFPDHGLRFLFLINNSNFIWQNLQDRMTAFSSLQVYVATLFDKVKAYMESYLQVSWAPLLSCLFNHKPLCLFGKNYSPLPLSKFESEFQKMYTTQKLWKVPNPEVRKRLRKAITEEIVSGYIYNIHRG